MFPEIKSFIDEKAKDFPSVKVEYKQGAYPTLLLFPGLESEASEAESVSIDKWKIDHITDFLAAKLEPGVTREAAWGAEDEAECVDDSEYCGDWASKGECQNNPEYMLESCKKSCGVCSADGGAEAASGAEAETKAETEGAVAGADAGADSDRDAEDE